MREGNSKAEGGRWKAGGRELRYTREREGVDERSLPGVGGGLHPSYRAAAAPRARSMNH
jgi:hypothetical protein